MNKDTSSHQWKPEMLNDKLGARSISLLEQRPGELILDLGCGTGDLTAEIAAAGAIPTGIDMSEESVSKARQKYPQLNIQVGDACHYRTDVHFDAVFSNAVIHWIKDAPAVARTIWLALREGGRFVAEFAGSGNVASMTSAIEQALEEHGYAGEGRSPWYLPTIGEYTSLLEQTGFRVLLAQHFDKLTSPMAGIRIWLDNFADYFFYDVSPADKESIYSAIEAKLKPHFYQGDQWILDTSRLRIVAIK